MSVEMRREFIQNMKFPYFSLQIMEHYMSQVFISLCLGKSPCHNFFDNIHRVSRTLMHLIDFKSLAIFRLYNHPLSIRFSGFFVCLGFQVGIKALSIVPTESTIFNVNGKAVILQKLFKSAHIFLIDYRKKTYVYTVISTVL